jgi:hypothetical protein
VTRWLPSVLGLACALSSPGCDTVPAVSRGAAGPYSLHCTSIEGSVPTCVRFHAPTGRVRRLALDRIPKGKTDPEKGAPDSVYTLSCHQAPSAAGEHAMLCLRMDTQSGEVVFIEAQTLPTGL